jgi:hypothetical protein
MRCANDEKDRDQVWSMKMWKVFFASCMLPCIQFVFSKDAMLNQTLKLSISISSSHSSFCLLLRLSLSLLSFL